MATEKEETFDRIIEDVGYKFSVAKYLVQRGFQVAITLLVWGGAVWFGSLGLAHKQGSVFFAMGFGVWLLIFRLMVPDAWYMSKEMMAGWLRWLKSYIFKRIG